MIAIIKKWYFEWIFERYFQKNDILVAIFKLMIAIIINENIIRYH